MSIIGNIESAAANAEKSLDDINEAYLKRLNKTLKAAEDKILDLTTRISLNVAGEVKGPKWTLGQAAQIQGQLEDIFDTNYGQASRYLAERMQGIKEIVIEVYAAVEIPIQFGKADIKMLKILQNQTLEGLKAFSLQTQERVSQSIQDAIIVGKPYRKLTDEIRNHITGLVDKAGRSLTAYANVYAQDGLMTAYRRLSMQKAKEIKIKYFIWMGNVVAGTRPMCAKNAGRTFSEQELQELDLYSWAGKSCSVFICCGGWNCRHHLMSISDNYFEKLGGEPIKVPNWFEENGQPLPKLQLQKI